MNERVQATAQQIPVRVSRVPENTRGRDFVIGDVHGHRDVLLVMLEAIRFDPSADRLFATGDLCDRGPDSLGCLDLLKSAPWFFSVAGNHEQSLRGQLLLAEKCEARGTPRDTIVETLRTLSGCRRMGDEWLAGALASTADWTPFFELGGRLSALPHILVIEKAAGQRVNIVHAELLSAGLASDAAIDAVQTLPCEAYESLTWSRKLWDELMDANHVEGERAAEGLSLTICGHNTLHHPLEWKKHLFLDTGCGHQGKPWMGLSCLCLQTGERYFVGSSEVVPGGSA